MSERSLGPTFIPSATFERTSVVLFVLLWFLAGLAIGLIAIGFLGLGSYERGYRRAHREYVIAELHARHPLRLAAQRATQELRRRTASARA